MIEKITCPQCQFQFDIEDALARDLEKDYQRRFAEAKRALELEQQRQLEAIQRERKDLEDKKRRENELFQDRLNKAIVEQRENMLKQIREEYVVKLEAQSRELSDSREKIKSMLSQEEAMLRKQRQMDEVLQQKEIDLQKRLMEETVILRQELAKSIGEENELKLREKDKLLEDQNKLIRELKRKSEQGSIQLQGEVQELAIEEYLKVQFPFDHIDEIRKGARGADCLQTVNTPYGHHCGTIYYESKRAKDFQPAWIEKFKHDIREKGADIGVLVSQVLPKDMSQMGEKNGIWICNYGEFKVLSYILRQMLINIHQVRETQSNSMDKKELIYRYLTSKEFKMRFEAIAEGLMQMQSDLASEKRAITAIWSKRQKQIDKIMGNAASFVGSIKGIAGAAIPTIESLEQLPEG